jgi:hypothetical protein
MRSAILAVTMVALTLVTGPLRAAPKALPADVGPGRVAWFDITTTDLPQSKEFYGKLFDWKFTPPLVLDPAGHPVGMYSKTPLAPAVP